MRRVGKASGAKKRKDGALCVALSVCTHGEPTTRVGSRGSRGTHGSSRTRSAAQDVDDTTPHAHDPGEDTDVAGSTHSSALQPCASPCNDRDANAPTSAAESEPSEDCRAVPVTAELDEMATPVTSELTSRDNPLVEFHRLPLAKQFRRMEREFAFLEATTMDPTQYDFRTSQRQMTFNRYFNVMANEDTIFPSCRPPCRVSAATLPDESGDVPPHAAFTPQPTPSLEPPQYINGNVIDLGVEPVFVACQAPPPHVIDTFLETLYEHDVRLVVMLTSLTENGMPKADRYWPDVEGKDGGVAEVCYGDRIRVTTDPLTPYEYDPALHLARRSLLLYRRRRPAPSCGTDAAAWSAPHRLLQVQYTGWPDQGVPHTTSAFDALLQILRQYAQGEADEEGRRPPVVVHCSAGIGRTGTLIGAYAAVTLLQQGRMTKRTIMELVATMRRARFGMVQRVEQYFFMYQIVLHYIGVDVTDFADMLQSKTEELRLRLLLARDQRALDRSRGDAMGGGGTRGRLSPRSWLATLSSTGARPRR